LLDKVNNTNKTSNVDLNQIFEGISLAPTAPGKKIIATKDQIKLTEEAHNYAKQRQSVQHAASLVKESIVTNKAHNHIRHDFSNFDNRGSDSFLA